MIFRIQKMPKPAPDYFRYFAPPADRAAWGLALTAAGFTRIAPGAAYPPARHPADHHFAWEHGRVLEALQIVVIGAGRGRLELRGCEPQRVTAGMAFALLPHVWHRYRPDADSGWTESWIEVQGPVVDRLLAKGVFALKTAVRAGGPASGLDAALEAVHAVAREAGPGFDPELTARAFAVLAAWARSDGRQAEPSRMRRAILAAERQLAERLTEPVNIEALARRLGVAYSHFRRAFRAHTGYAPWKYVLHLRLTQARRLLAGSDATLDDIAARLGFSSGFHLSTVFKQTYGLPPDHWRQQLRAISGGRSQASPTVVPGRAGRK